MTKKIAIALILTSCLIRIKAQVHDRYPTLFNQYFNHLQLINPAEIANNHRIEYNIGNQSLTGDFNNIGNYFTNISMGISGNDSTQNYHTVALNFCGEKEGSLFSNSRIYVGYAIKVSLRPKCHLSFGIFPGLISYSIKATPYNGGGNAHSFDASAGLCLSTSKIKIGMALNQFPNATLTPLAEQLIMRRFTSIYLQHIGDLGLNLKFKSIIQTNIQKSKKITPNLAEQLLIKELLSIGFSYTYLRNYGFMIGIENIPFAKGRIKTAFSYQIPVNNRKIAQNTNTIAIAISYFHK